MQTPSCRFSHDAGTGRAEPRRPHRQTALEAAVARWVLPVTRALLRFAPRGRYGREDSAAEFCPFLTLGSGFLSRRLVGDACLEQRAASGAGFERNNAVAPGGIVS